MEADIRRDSHAEQNAARSGALIGATAHKQAVGGRWPLCAGVRAGKGSADSMPHLKSRNEQPKPAHERSNFEK